jgi:predicted O-methyltransferase YrrM
MFKRIKGTIKRRLFRTADKIPIRWTRRNEDSWIAKQFTETFVKLNVDGFSRQIERIASRTNKLGPQPLWEGYLPQSLGSTRLPKRISTTKTMGNFFAGLVKQRRPQIIVEFGTAFGVSGMYWLAGLEANQKGELLTFEPNEAWASIAKQNLSEISNRFTLVVGTFENNIDKHLIGGKTIDITFIDAIHKREFVVPQLELVVARSSSRGLIILDDINFSDDMQGCWEEIATDRRFAASAALGRRVGILELNG